tara:strand:+ start:953 stop:1096 length:144 start_codon:yes stop_codon:yes gene_type:complete
MEDNDKIKDEDEDEDEIKTEELPTWNSLVEWMTEQIDSRLPPRSDCG